jgi:hypothetical protein
MMQEDTTVERRLHQLSASQREVLVNFQEISQINDDVLCLEILQQNQWNLESALNNFVQGGNSRANLDAEDEPVDPSLFNHDFGRSANQNSSNRNENQGRNVQQNSSGSLIDLLLVPLRWLFQARPTSLNPNQDAETFIADFQSNYDRNRVVSFHSGSYQSAVARAFTESKFLVVYLHSPMHEDTDRFCEQVLVAPTFTTLINEQVVIWGGKVWDAEAYGLSTQLGAAAFPFLALLVPQSNRLVQIADRMQGFTEVTPLIARLRGSIDVYSAVMTQQREQQRRR